MNLETRQRRRHKLGKSLVTTGMVIALVGIVWWSQIRFSPLTKIDSTTLETIQVETPHSRSNKRFISSMMVVGGAASVAVGKLLTSESRF